MSSIEILLIEDSPADIELTQHALNNGKIKNQLTVISDGEKALQFLFKQDPHQQARTPDIILLDLNLPKVDGREILQALKSEPTLASIPVIVLSSSEAAADIQQSYRLHANCFISKPVQLEDFMEVIRMVETFWIDIVRLPSFDTV